MGSSAGRMKAGRSFASIEAERGRTFDTHKKTSQAFPIACEANPQFLNLCQEKPGRSVSQQICLKVNYIEENPKKYVRALSECNQVLKPRRASSLSNGNVTVEARQF